MNIRYGQLAYTSFDEPGVAGGWRIKQVRGALSAAEAQTLVGGVRTAFDAVDPLPTYPTPDQLQRAPRRLAYRRLDAHRAAYWHTFPAGSDNTGRPGNVFAHALLDRDPDAAPRHRPIQLWRSPQWLCPYGAAEVARVGLPEQVPGAAAAVTKDSVLAFALDTTTWRLATLFGMLDAVAAALDGGAPVVLGVESADAAAQWIGLASFLMSPGTAGRLNFSTFDRADQLGPTLTSGPHVTAVPVGDLPSVPAGLTVIDETATMSLGELGGEPHRTASGQRIAVSPWSAMAQVVLLEPGSARAVLDDIDRYAAQVEDSSLPPAWPMAMAVALNGTYADAHAEAHSVIAAYTPEGVAAGSAVDATISEVVTALIGTTTADAWRAVQQAPEGPASRHADVAYVIRALADDSWLNQLRPVPVGLRHFERTTVPAELAAAVGPALAQARRVGPDQVVRLVDFLMRAGVADDQLSAALRTDVVDCLRDPQSGPKLIHRLGRRIGVEARLVLAAEALKAGTDRDGTTDLSDEVLDWLADEITAPAPSELARAYPWNTTWTRAALRGVRPAHSGSDPADGCARLWWLRVSGSPDFEEAVATQVWDPAELLAAADGAPPGLSVLPTLLGAPDSVALTELASAVLDARTDDTVMACADIRLTEPRIWLQRRQFTDMMGLYNPHVDAVLQALGPDRLHPDFAARVLTLAAIATIMGQPYPGTYEVLAADPMLAARSVAQMSRLVEDRALTPAALVAAALMRTGGGEDRGASAAGVADVLRQAAHRIVATHGFTDREIDSAAELMAKMSGADPERSTLRHNRELVTRLVSRRPGTPPPLSASVRENL